MSFQDLGECKQTEGKHIKLQQRWLAKIEEEGAELGKMPFVHIRFLNRLQMREMCMDWVLMPSYAFETLLEVVSDSDA